MIVALALATVIGFSLSLMGSGGSIITLPVLVYSAGIPVGKAVGMSLAVVGGTSVVASAMNARAGLVHGKAAFLFSSTGIPGALGGALLTPLVPPGVLMLIFAGLMTVVAVLMLRQKTDAAPPQDRRCKWPRCAASGLVVGGLTGFLGVGGGFVIVPAMVLFGNLPFKMAAATSLVVIAVNSFAGLVGQMRQTQFDWPATGMFFVAAVAGMVVGRAFSGRIATPHLRKAFAWFVLAVAVFVIAKNTDSIF